MKRDMDLVRKILLAMEENEHGFGPYDLQLDGFDEETIGYHVYLMGQAGLIDAVDTTTRGNSSPSAVPTKLTWEGHEFLDAAKSETLWNKAKTQIKEKGLSMTLDLLKDVLSKLAKQMIGLP